MRRLIFGIFVLLTAFNVEAQTAEVSKITSALSVGNASAVSEMFLANLDLSVDGNDDIYSKAQATQILRSFFERNAVQKFTVNHEGTSRTNDIYRIGTLATKNGSYRVTFFLKNEGNKFLIKELRIEKATGF